MEEPKTKDLFRHIDDRGVLDMIFNLDLPFDVKRIYTTINKKGIIRGMHGHRNEWKAFYCFKGAIKIVASHMDKDEIKGFILDEMKPQLFILPKNYYHGYTSLSEEARVVILSSATLEDSKKDDHRLEPKGFKEYFEVVDR
ncbi:MAG: WxcM-like domain-containing protein [Candidatus Thermoplasmatota archaeon]|nr:WxcM-like domain-containing protein [Candidatus Thermoplasmatota archaeon]